MQKYLCYKCTEHFESNYYYCNGNMYYLYISTSFCFTRQYYYRTAAFCRGKENHKIHISLYKYPAILTVSG